jgi:hypothetical protein
LIPPEESIPRNGVPMSMNVLRYRLWSIFHQGGQELDSSQESVPQRSWFLPRNQFLGIESHCPWMS